MRPIYDTPFETLETRRFHSISLSKGVLACYGSARNDTIGFSVADGKLTVTVSRQAAVVDVAAVKSVIINGMYGQDAIDARDLPLKATINAGEGNDTVYGSAFDDSIFGNAGNDTLIGGSGNDALNGGDGDDWLTGGKGNDKLTGGRGADRFNGGQGTDTYADLNAAEKDKDDDLGLFK